MTTKLTKEQHNTLKLHIVEMLLHASKMQELVKDDLELLDIIEKFFRVSIDFSSAMIRKGYGDD